METMTQLMTGESTALLLSILLLLSFVLPFTAKRFALEGHQDAKPEMRTVWTGQLLTAFGALLIICIPEYPFFGFSIAIASCIGFTVKLRRQLAVMPVHLPR